MDQVAKQDSVKNLGRLNQCMEKEVLSIKEQIKMIENDNQLLQQQQQMLEDSIAKQILQQKMLMAEEVDEKKIVEERENDWQELQAKKQILHDTLYEKEIIQKEKQNFIKNLQISLENEKYHFQQIENAYQQETYIWAKQDMDQVFFIQENSELYQLEQELLTKRLQNRQLNQDLTNQHLFNSQTIDDLMYKINLLKEADQYQPPQKIFASQTEISLPNPPNQLIKDINTSTFNNFLSQRNTLTFLISFLLGLLSLQFFK